MGSPKTPTTNTNPLTYLPVSEFLKRADYNTVGQLCADAPPAPAVATPVALSALPSNPNLLAAITDAAGIFESYLLKGERYTVADILALPAGPPVSAGLGMVYQIMSDLTMAMLYKRRPSMIKNSQAFDLASGWCERLGSGDTILGFDEVADAGVLHTERITEQDVREANGIVHRCRGLFGSGARRYEC